MAVGGYSSADEQEVVQKLRSKLLSVSTSLAGKHRVLFALRSLQTAAAQEALAAGACFSDGHLRPASTRAMLYD